MYVLGLCGIVTMMIQFLAIRKSIAHGIRLRSFYVLFFLLAIFSLQFQIKSNGTLLFLIYLVFLFLFRPPHRTTLYLALLSFLLVPILLMGQYSFTAENLAVFSYLLLILSVIQLCYSLRKNQ